ncbi:MAG: hypothetical protein IKE94_06390 [Aeriscardovia sp.]|nr:hypothetical protein [Aeriscardovia sp.]
MMSIGKVVYGVIAVLVVVLIVATVLIPTISGLELEGTYATLLGVVSTLCIIIPVMMCVKMISGGRD